MTTYVYRNGKLVDKSRAAPKHAGSGASYVISDEMAPTRHMADGKFYTSKKKFRDATRAAGCVEVGNETATLLKPRAPITLDRGARREAIRHAIHQLQRR
ncbi:MAG TPA: hypothetical protein VGN15_13830 [Ktedonobacteraceae bacterium]|nr:hypothetical protein [Ktedonobacteraceae bacterium]